MADMGATRGASMQGPFGVRRCTAPCVGHPALMQLMLWMQWMHRCSDAVMPGGGAYSRDRHGRCRALDCAGTNLRLCFPPPLIRP